LVHAKRARSRSGLPPARHSRLLRVVARALRAPRTRIRPNQNARPGATPQRNCSSNRLASFAATISRRSGSKHFGPTASSGELDPRLRSGRQPGVPDANHGASTSSRRTPAHQKKAKQLPNGNKPLAANAEVDESGTRRPSVAQADRAVAPLIALNYATPPVRHPRLRGATQRSRRPAPLAASPTAPGAPRTLGHARERIEGFWR